MHARNYRLSAHSSRKRWSYSISLITPEIRVAIKELYQDWFYPLMHGKKLKIWKNMNRSAFLQPRVLSAMDLKETFKRDCNMSTAGNRNRNIPNKILQLLHQGIAWKLHYADDTLQRYTREFNDDYSFDIVDKRLNYQLPIDASMSGARIDDVVFEILSFDVMKKVERNIPDDVRSDDSIEPLDDSEFNDNPLLTGVMTEEGVEFEVLTFDVTKKGFYLNDPSYITDISTNVSSRVTHVGPKGRKHVPRNSDGSRAATADDQFVQTFLSSKFVGESGKVTQFEAITAGPDLERTSKSTRARGQNELLSDDLMLQWQLEPIEELEGINFEVLAFDIYSAKKEKSGEDYLATNNVIDQKVVSKILVSENESDMVTDNESGMIFEILSFDLNAKQMLITEKDGE